MAPLMENAHAVRLPAGDGHQVLERGPVRLAEESEDLGLLAALARFFRVTRPVRGGFLALLRGPER